ncbi:MAG: AI-2E family transporter [Saprospiraceae bacterium]|nr:AI-2E family transporter [Saprospiraceae bacterium]
MNKWWLTLKQGRTIALIASLILISLVVYFFADIVTYILLAWVISMIGAPFMNLLKRIRFKNRSLGPSFRAAITLALFFTILGLLVWIFVPMIMAQAISISKVNYVAIAQSLEEPLEALNQRLKEIGLVNDTRSPSEQVISVLRTWFEPAKFGAFFTSFLALAGNLLIGLFSVIFIAFFFLREEGLFKDFVSSLVPQEYALKVRDVIDEVSDLLSRYFGGIVLQISLITMIVTFFLELSGVRNALLIGFFAGIINVIPYIGPIIGAVFGVMMTISSNLDLNFYSEMRPLLFKVLGTFALVQLMDNFIFQPFILGSRVLAHPLEIFIVVMVGAKIGGVTGMVLAIPAYTVLRVIARVFLNQFSLVQKMTRRMEDHRNGQDLIL